jgi:TM2 domain-containing membrane protein YozV
MKKFIGVILLLFSSYLPGQDILNEHYDYAKDLFLKENYFDAITEFKRLIFFDTLKIYTAESEFFIGVSYKKGGFYNSAIGYLSSVLRKTDNSLLALNAQKEIIKSNILRRTTSRALQLITELEMTISSNEDKRELDLMSGYAYVFDRNWEKGIEYFRSAGYNELSELTKDVQEMEYSETKAKILSAFIPGAGQIYTGRYLNGILSLTLNAATLYLTINSFVDDRIFDGIMTGNFLWYRFYSGNIYNAGKFARENNDEIFNWYLLQLQEYVKYKL